MKESKLDKHVKKYLKGDSFEFDIIYEETKKFVYLSIYTYVKNQMTIDDLMQDTYLKVIENINKYRIGTNFNSWICTIARNIAINYYHKNKKEDLVEEYIGGENPNNDSLVNLALSVLKGLEREVLIYHIVLNFKFSDISKILDKPLGTIYSLYKKAIQTIKEKI